jgi:putative SOS response-associated peptidase YedK
LCAAIVVGQTAQGVQAGHVQRAGRNQSGYYEWRATPEGKQPFYFTRRDGQVMTIAGLWSNWSNESTGEALKSCTMVITEPNRFVAEVHDRMPV